MKNVKKRTFHIKRYETLSSTNCKLKSLSDQVSPWFTIMADEQTKGRGRELRTWQSETGKDLTFSTLFPVTKEIAPYLPNIPQLAALAVVKILEAEGINAQIKWPNDILVQGKKICGILVEGICIGAEQKVIVGIGLNVNSIPKTLDVIKTTTMLHETNREHDLETVAEGIVIELQGLHKLLSQKGMSFFHSLLDYYLAYKNEQRIIQIQNKKVTATILSVTASGTLRISVNGTIQEINSGEISFNVESGI